MPVILGVSPYAGASALALALEKRGERSPAASAKPTEGHRQEAASRDWLAEELGAAVDYQPRRDDFALVCCLCGSRALMSAGKNHCRNIGCKNQDAGFLHANLDGQIVYQDVVSNFEHKAISYRNPDYWVWQKNVPIHVRVQVQQQMLCAGLTQTVIVLFNGPWLERKIYTETADPEFQRWLLSVGARWWERAVVRQEDPDEEWWEGLTALLKERWPPVEQEALVLGADELELAQEWLDAGVLGTLARKARKRLEAELRKRLKTAVVGLFPDGSAIVRSKSDRLTYKSNYGDLDDVSQSK
jgi:predicted phage-related endonuclease